MARESLYERIVLGLRTEERPRGVGAPTLPPPTREAPPTKEEAAAANAGAYKGSTRTVERVGGNKLLKIAAAGGILGAGAYAAYETIPAVHDRINSFLNSFTDNRLVPKETINKDGIFDNTATRGVKSERNTIKITPEEYQKIAPPVIDREDRKEVPGEFALPPDTAKATGNKTRKLTLEQGTSVNALIYVKTPDGKVRETTYTKITNPGEVTGRYPLPMTAPNCNEYLGLKGEIQAGDIFPAPISGRVYRGNTLTDYNGSTSDDYYIVDEYYDKKGKKFLVSVLIRALGTTKPLIENVPNRDDEAFKEKVKVIDSSGKEIEASFIDKDKIPIVMVQQGQDLFKFITKPRVDGYNPHSSIKSQVAIGGSYRDIRDVDQDIRHEGFSDIFGGENCSHPTLDNKAIVLIQ